MHLMHLPLLKQFRPGWPALLGSSLLLNAALGYSLLMPQPQTSQTSVLPASKPMAAKAPASALRNAWPFHWSQMDAPDFPTYAKNLRDIGCPEATIRDILAGELDEVYRQKEAQSGPSSGRINASERARQQTEREQILAQLMQTATPTGATAAAPAIMQTASSGGGGIMQSANEKAARQTSVIPAAFAFGAPSGATAMQGGQPVLTAAAEQSYLPANTAASLKQMQNDFASELGNATQDPASEEYRAAWNLATQKSDERFSSLFGGDVFVRTQLEAVRAAAGKATH